MGSSGVVVLGGGPAGLTAAYLLSRSGVPVTVLETDPRYVGGISRTEEYRGYRFDIGGHRFFSKSEEIENLWTEILGDDLLSRPRLSRIYYNGKFFSYPLQPREALLKLGILESLRCVASYLKSRVNPIADPRSFEDWVSNQFGERLFRIFFKTYTEKVWGMSCKEISADWAAQRIKGLSLGSAIWNAVRPRSLGSKSNTIKTLIHSFRYPRLGPGMMWERCAEKIRENGGRVLLGQRAVACERLSDSAWTVTAASRDGALTRFECGDVISSVPIKELVRMLAPSPSVPVRESADALRYRDFLTVALIVKDQRELPDNWIYIHDPRVKVGRNQNDKSWSPEMVPDPSTSCFGLEYFCFEGDGLWNMTDQELVAMASREINQLGLARREDLVDGCVVRQKKAYPVYDDQYRRHVAAVRQEIEAKYQGLHLVGRNGMHKYNNQDHAMMTALLAARNILAGRKVYDVWGVNEDAEYHETETAAGNQGASGLRAVPTPVCQPTT
jgi:protoporphyrinogen oxidase